MEYTKPAVLNEVPAQNAIQGGSSLPKGMSQIDANVALESAAAGYEADE